MGMEFGADIRTKVQNAAISARVTHKDGSVTEYGVVSYYSKNPLKRLKYYTLKRLGRVVTEAQLFT